MLAEACWAILLIIGFVFWTLQGEYPARFLDWYASRTPPGPFSYPFIGATNIDPTQPWKTLAKWGTQYGGIFSLYLGTEFTVVVTDFDIIKEALNAPEFSGRPLKMLSRRLYKNRGLSFVDGDVWKEQRRFCSTTLKNLGAGPGRCTSSLDDLLQACSQDLKKYLQDKNGQPFYMRETFDKVVVDATSGVVHKGPLTSEDPRFPRLIQCYKDFFTVNSNTGLLNVMPWLRYLPPFRSQYKVVEAAANDMELFGQQVMLERQAAHPEPVSSEEPPDLMDAFRAEQAKANHGTSFTDDQLASLAADIVMAGSEDIIQMMLWVVVCIVIHPAVQKQAQHFVDEVIGRERLPSLKDRNSLPYIDAIVQEVCRFSNLAPYPLPRRALQTFKFRGYAIPKDTVLITNAFAVHFSEEYWSDPWEFRPDRFLDKNGKLVSSPLVLAFGGGRRVCPGEAFAKQQMFMFLCTILQNFDIMMPPGYRVPTMDDIVYGVAISPKPFDVAAVPR